MYLSSSNATVTLFITMLCGTTCILWDTIFNMNVGNILHNTISPIDHYYEQEQYYDNQTHEI